MHFKYDHLVDSSMNRARFRPIKLSGGAELGKSASSSPAGAIAALAAPAVKIIWRSLKPVGTEKLP